ncbi:MAG TPA: hypothetical protein VF032_19480 [Thermoleophilaceae bacterium]
MKKKLGPLQLWQWVAIGVAVGLGAYLWSRRSSSTSPGTLAGSAFNPIDPTTGLPVSGGVTTGGATDTTGNPTSLQNELADLGAIEQLLAGLQSLQPLPPVGDQTNTDPGTVSVHTGAAPAPKPKSALEKAKERVARGVGGSKTINELLAAGYSRGQITHALKTRSPLGKPKNHPAGHHVTHHAGGRKRAASTHPHNPRQHHNVAPPSHQRHHPTKHPSAAPKPMHIVKPKPKKKVKK